MGSFKNNICLTFLEKNQPRNDVGIDGPSQRRRARFPPSLESINLARVSAYSIIIFCIFRILHKPNPPFPFFFSISQIRKKSISDGGIAVIKDVGAITDIHARRFDPVDLQPLHQRAQGVSDRHVDPLVPPGGAIRCGELHL